MKIVYILMIITGLPVIGWGFWAANRAKSPMNIVGAIAAPVGLVITLLGILLTCVPNFFRG